MPLFEYECKKCGNKFEKLIFSTDKGAVKCPKCGSEETKKLISLFSSKGSCNVPTSSSFG